MSIFLIILVLILLFGGIGAYPRWGYSTGWGYGPSGLFGLLLVVLILMAILGQSPI